jgi:hypothetical protein
MDVAETVDKLLFRLERKTEEIQSVRQRLSRLESERAEIREQIKGCLGEDDRIKESRANGAESDLLFKPDQLNRFMNAGSYARSTPIDHHDAAKALREAAEAVRSLGGEVDAHRLAGKLAISFDAARLRLARACTARLVRRIRTGKYVPVESIAKDDVDIAF